MLIKICAASGERHIFNKTNALKLVKWNTVLGIIMPYIYFQQRKKTICVSKVKIEHALSPKRCF